MEAVGYDLYCKMLNESVRELKGEQQIQEKYETVMDLDIDAYIPDKYIRNEYQKLDIYKRIAMIESRFEFGVFCPVFRLHGFRLPYPERDILNPDGYCGSGGPNEVWSFGETAYQIITKYMFLREKMIPYIMEQMERLI